LERKKAEQPSPEELIGRIRFPRRNELEQFAVVMQLLGVNKVMVACEDGKERIARIPGRMRKRVWMRNGDLVLVKLWDFQQAKCDIIWRYVGVQVEHLRKKGLLNNLPL
jgi:translation initiation factor 1A